MRYSIFVKPLGKLVYESDNLERVADFIFNNKSCCRKFMVYDNYKKKFLRCCDYKGNRREKKGWECNSLLVTVLVTENYYWKYHIIIYLIPPNKKPRKHKFTRFWRGLRDLNSRARFQTYSLSRGAPSPLG